MKEERREVILSKPLKISGELVKVLRMREPTVGDQLAAQEAAADKNEVLAEIHLLANLCEVPPDAIKQMSLPDYAAAQAVFRTFLE